MIEIHDLCKFYQVGQERVRALDHASLHIRPHEFVSIIGPSGIVECMADENEQILYAEVELNNVDLFRSQMPTRKLMRPDVYTIME